MILECCELEDVIENKNKRRESTCMRPPEVKDLSTLVFVVVNKVDSPRQT